MTWGKLCRLEHRDAQWGLQLTDAPLQRKPGRGGGLPTNHQITFCGITQDPESGVNSGVLGSQAETPLGIRPAWNLHSLTGVQEPPGPPDDPELTPEGFLVFLLRLVETRPTQPPEDTQGQELGSTQLFREKQR